GLGVSRLGKYQRQLCDQGRAGWANATSNSRDAARGRRGILCGACALDEPPRVSGECFARRNRGAGGGPVEVPARQEVRGGARGGGSTYAAVGADWSVRNGKDIRSEADSRAQRTSW